MNRILKCLLLRGCLLAAVVVKPITGVGAPLLATDAASQELFTVSTTDGSHTQIGGFGVPGYMAGLAYDFRNNRLYGTTTDTDQLFSIDPQTGTARLVGPLGVSLMHGLAYDDVNGVLYGASTSDAGLYRISAMTGQATRIGRIGIFGFGGQVTGLDFNPLNNTLYGCLRFVGPGVGGIVTIDTTTGLGTLVASTRPFQSLAFNADSGVLYGADNGIGVEPDSLYTVDLSTGAATLVGQTGLGNNLGIEFVQVPEPSTTLLLALGLVGIVGLRMRLSQ